MCTAISHTSHDYRAGHRGLHHLCIVPATTFILPSSTRKKPQSECEVSIAAAAAAKLLQSCLTLCDPIDGSPPGSAGKEHWSGLPFPSPMQESKK